MSTDTVTPKTKNTWVVALLISMAVNGLLVGLLLSKQVDPKMRKPELYPAQSRVQAMPNNPRHLVRTLSLERRKQVMTTAMKNLKSQDTKHPRRLFKQLRQAKLKTMVLMSADELDVTAIEQSLAGIREINQKLAISGDALMIEVLGQLTSEERKQARETLKRETLKRNTLKNRQMHPRKANRD